MKKSKIFITAIVTFIAIMSAISCKNEKIITFRSLLREMSEADAITRFPDPSYRLVQLPFNESIRADIELWHWVKTTIDYSVTSYYHRSPEV